MTDEVKCAVKYLRESAEFQWCSDCCASDGCGGAYKSDCHYTRIANLIESLSDKNKQLEYTLVGVMHFVDKWLDDIEPYSLVDDPSGKIAVDRAAEARRITLEHIEDLTREIYRRGQELSEVQKQRDAAVKV